LEQDEAELEARVAGWVVEARDVLQAGETPREGDEVQQQEHQPGNEKRRVVQHVVEGAPADRQRDVPELADGVHVRVILVCRARPEATSASVIRPAAMANASPNASPFQPSMIRLRRPSIRYETGLTVASQRNQLAAITLRGQFIAAPSPETH